MSIPEWKWFDRGSMKFPERSRGRSIGKMYCAGFPFCPISIEQNNKLKVNAKMERSESIVEFMMDFISDRRLITGASYQEAIDRKKMPVIAFNILKFK